jgi:hypothetical protein
MCGHARSRQPSAVIESFPVSLADLASLATAGGLVLVVVQLVLGRLQTRTALEDDLAREYRDIASRIPFAAFFDREDPRHPLPPLDECLVEYVRYFDLSNQQVFLRMERRVSRKTWEMWSDGIEDNLRRDGFRDAWEYVRHHSGRSYNELASLYRHWNHDPAYWEPPSRLRPWKALRGLPDRPKPRNTETS